MPPPRLRKRPRELPSPKRRKNPQGLTYGYFHGLIPLLAKSYIREVGQRLGLSDARALGVIVLEHQSLARQVAR